VKFGATLTALGLMSATSAFAQAWPSAKPITIIVPYAAGTVTDLVGRLIAEDLGKRLNQQVMIENRAGAGATIGTSAFSKAAPDGYTLLVTGPSPIVNAPLLYKTLSYDPSKFTPVTMVMSSPIMVIVNNDVPAKNLKELIAYAKANPGKLNAGETGNGSTHQLLHYVFEKAAKIDLNLVSYKSTPILDLVAGRIDLILDYPGAYRGHVKDGKIRILANLYSSRHKSWPDVPTMAEAGLPEYPDWLGWYAVYGPPGMPADIVARLNKEIAAYLATPEAAEKFAVQDLLPTSSTPEAVTKQTTHETQVIGAIIKENNIQLDNP
jgi:tripartite-type tricarboxylate transporter receptor subunit TctC